MRDDLFTRTLPFQHGSATSEAAGAAAAKRAPAIRSTIFAFIKSRGQAGATADEIEKHLNIPGNTVRPRLVELREDFRIERAPTTRPTRAGRQAVVWVAIDAR